MKRPPAPGERSIRHITTNTSHAATFAICDENFHPDAITMMPSLEEAPFLGYTLDVIREEPLSMAPRVEFIVKRGTRPMTANICEWFGDTLIVLTTILTADMSEDEAAMLADLEQCAAIALCPPPPAVRMECS